MQNKEKAHLKINALLWGRGEKLPPWALIPTITTPSHTVSIYFILLHQFHIEMIETFRCQFSITTYLVFLQQSNFIICFSRQLKHSTMLSLQSTTHQKKSQKMKDVLQIRAAAIQEEFVPTGSHDRREAVHGNLILIPKIHLSAF